MKYYLFTTSKPLELFGPYKTEIGAEIYSDTLQLSNPKRKGKILLICNHSDGRLNYMRPVRIPNTSPARQARIRQQRIKAE